MTTACLIALGLTCAISPFKGYRPTVLAARDGRVFAGIVHEETAGELTLVDMNGQRQDVVERKTMDTSLMPDGFYLGLSLKEFSDLIAYLASLRSAGQGTPGSGVVGPVRCPKASRALRSPLESPARPRWKLPQTAASWCASRPEVCGSSKMGPCFPGHSSASRSTASGREA